MRSVTTRILFTNNTLSTRAGTELWVRDMTIELHARGYLPAAYSSVLGPVADEMRDAGIPVVDHLDGLPWRPDLIHGQHHLEAMTALVRFPDVPAVFVCHGAIPWEEEPLLHPAIRRWIAVDSACRQRLVDARVPEDRITTLFNFVDLARFERRSALDAEPRRALVFSNTLTESNGLETIRKACHREGISVEVAGLAAGRIAEKPEELLREFDLVFARGRAALEAMATGCAVILCDTTGVGPYVRSADLPELRELNFGFRALTSPLTLQVLRDRIRAFDAADAGLVCTWIREHASLRDAAKQLEKIYNETLDEDTPIDREEQSRAVAEYIRGLAMRVKFHEGVRHERDVLAERVRRLAIRRFLMRR
ncbi:MAG: glycosyltransferase [Thermoanaerobaculia bacterium]